MIPEEYWNLARRWFWLIGLFGALGVAAGLALIATGKLGQKSSYVASTTIGVTRLMTFDGSVIQGNASSSASTAVTDYAKSLVDWSKTPQFVADLRHMLATKGIEATTQAIVADVSVASSGPLMISITGRGKTSDLAAALSNSGAQVLQNRAQADETAIRSGLQTNLQQNLNSLEKQLQEVDQKLNVKLQSVAQSAILTSLNNLIARGFIGSGDQIAAFQKIVSDLAQNAADPELAVLQSQETALKNQIDQTVRASVAVDSSSDTWPTPVVTVSPVQSVSSPTAGLLRKRDVLALSLAAGLVMGWVAANLAERLRSRATRRAKRASGRPAGLEEEPV